MDNLEKIWERGVNEVIKKKFIWKLRWKKKGWSRWKVEWSETIEFKKIWWKKNLNLKKIKWKLKNKNKIIGGDEILN